MSLLEYENEMFLNAFQEDGLLVVARGLGISRLMLNFLKLYCDPGNLVLVVNTNDYEENYLIEELDKLGIKPLPKIITNEYGTNERTGVYMQGGVLFVSSRILVVDLLTERLPAHLVTGIIVNKAHKIIDSCQEAFILRLYRQKNKMGFIKAFSDQPQTFAAGLCKLERVMRNLFVRKLYLWPRFHAAVQALMERHKPEVIELQLTMTPAMVSIQMSILDIIGACIKEVKQVNPSLDSDDLTVENAIGKKSLTNVIRRQLDPIWHTLSSKTKQLVSDLKLLQMLLFYLTQYDCVTFYNFLKTLRGNERAMANNTGWLFLEAAEMMFVHAKRRIYGDPSDTKNKKQKTDKKETATNTKQTQRGLLLEENPKWRMLSEVLEEIRQENTGDTSGRVLICASDDRTCAQLREYLCDGSYALLQRLYQKTLGAGQPFTATAAQASGSSTSNVGGRDARGRGKGERSGLGKVKRKREDDEVTLTQIARKVGHLQGGQDEDGEGDEDDSQRARIPSTRSVDVDDEIELSSIEAYYNIETTPITVIHPLHGCRDPYSLTKTLHELEPRYVILYDAEIQFVRQLEVFKACRPNHPLRVYFLIYSGSTEEQKYLTSLRYEKSAFENLIKEKSTMVLPADIDGKDDSARELSRDPALPSASSSRNAGGQAMVTQGQKKIIVDMREFRSELPSLIHKRGIDIEPVTIEVGDYILTPDICVERKSISDLIGSLANGRLYNQALSMTRFYKRPVLLIEFNPNKSFALQTQSTMSNEISYQNLSSKLTLLTLHFPKLRILWCPSPHATAELFEELKIGRSEPDAAIAASITVEEEGAGEGGDESSPLTKQMYNHAPYDMLLKLPGINIKNCWRIMRNLTDLTELVSLSQERLGEILAHQGNAKFLWEFLHKEGGGEAEGTTNKPGGGGGKFAGRGRFGRGGRGFGGSGGRGFGGSGRGRAGRGGRGGR
ncbi:DNA repair endonuclease XPF [Strongylocentrotus purpuratus]|uniref:DNA repair endonuclease XPF n=1 Tax=Strongylocentrotus purpuratus TaxID=7668 RepID=A0A7M7PMQ9_STRPU|nr:DNA repair endonuclease XPF [Strongylocentrotus purpuratus]